jgi:hypothetical protein
MAQVQHLRGFCAVASMPPHPAIGRGGISG